MRFPRGEGEGLRGGEEEPEAAALYAGRRHRHRPADSLGHPPVVRAGGFAGQDFGGHCEPAAPEDDGLGEPGNAAQRRAHGKGRGEAEPDYGGRRHPRRSQAVLSGVPPLSIRAWGSSLRSCSSNR